MARTLFSGGRVFDARSGVTARADVVTDGDRIVDVGPGLDGDEQVDVSGATLLPGLFDCHVHLVFTHFDTLRLLAEPFSPAFFRTARRCRREGGHGHGRRPCGTTAPTSRSSG